MKKTILEMIIFAAAAIAFINVFDYVYTTFFTKTGYEFDLIVDVVMPAVLSFAVTFPVKPKKGKTDTKGK